jgi:hypothetical protein
MSHQVLPHDYVARPAAHQKFSDSHPVWTGLIFVVLVALIFIPWPIAGLYLLTHPQTSIVGVYLAWGLAIGVEMIAAALACGLDI